MTDDLSGQQSRPADPRDAEANLLWNAGLTPESFSSEESRYLAVVLEQYKLCLEMADRVSARRGIANSFFLTINVALVGYLVSPKTQISQISTWPLIVTIAALLGQCAVWFFLLRSYRMLNTAKYKVIEKMEERLPMRPFSRGEWENLSQAQGAIGHVSLSSLEQAMPALFALAEIVLFVA